LKCQIATVASHEAAAKARGGDQGGAAAAMSADPDEVRVGGDLPAEAAALAGAVVRNVAHSREAVLLGDAAREGRFTHDPHIAARKTRSILCLPLLQQGRLSSILYLENDAAPDAFTPERAELLQLLSTQAATAVENARLYADLQRAHADLQRSNEVLEQEVEQRTRDLRAASEELQRANEHLTRRAEELRALSERLQQELVERERTEREHAALQDRVIRAQEERLAEMSTPLIPITDRVMVMPLIGTLDEPRARQVMEAALGGASRSRAQVVILDVTGLRSIDAHVTRALLSTAGALRLLGAEAVLTGLRPGLAQLLVEQGEELGSLITRGTLQSGIAYALGRTGAAGRSGLR
jgi:anti-anti-sigma regulatory factor